MKKLLGLGLAVLLFLTGCDASSSSLDIEEIGQQLGDVMASIDEMGGSDGTLSMANGEQRALARRESPPRVIALPSAWLGELVSDALAASCSTSTTFGSCSSNVLTRTFSSCYIGLASFTGTVTLTWAGASNNCTVFVTGDTITRVPSLTITGRRSSTLTVSKSGTNGQVLTRASATIWSLTNDGIRRVFTSAAGATLFDYTTTTTTALGIVGVSRGSRTINSGTIRVTDNLSGTTCDFTPSSVSWGAASCVCPTAGSWSGSCSDGKSSTLTFRSCGVADFTLNSDTQRVSLDRCYSL